jgi:hypothetical protein
MSTTARTGVFAGEQRGATDGSRASLFRHSPRDAWLVGLAVFHGGLLAFGLTRVHLLDDWGALAFASLFGLGVCWSSNTVSHNHLHQPLFRTKALNVTLSWLLTLSLGVPQTLWRARHFWHHAGEPAQSRPRVVSRALAAEAAAILVLWCGLLAHSPRAFLTAYLPGYALGLLLCRLQGEMEHRQTRSRTRGVSYYGRLYNWLWFNDGYHAEHHRFPSEHWTRLPARSGERVVAESAWPPLLRWLARPRPAPGAVQAGLLGSLERIALHSRLTRRYLLWSHERAFRLLLPRQEHVTLRVAIIGGGLFPRTALVLRKILPHAQLTIVDQSEESLRIAREFLVKQKLDAGGLRFEHAAFGPLLADAHDLVVAPLAYVGDPSALLTASAGRLLLLHEWIWQRSSPHSAVISWLLLKRLSLVDQRRDGAS